MMVFPTKNNSGLVMRPNRKGQLFLYVNGQVLLTTKVECHSEYDRNEIIVTIPARLVTFEAAEKPADG